MSSSQNLRVGLFVTFLLLLLAGSLFAVSGGGKIFQEVFVINASWQDVAGLKEGSLVRLSGIDIGEVTMIQFSETAHQEVHVVLSVQKQYQSKIRQCDTNSATGSDENPITKQSSLAKIDSIGVLGDKFVAINIGDTSCPVIEEGAWIETREALAITDYAKQASGFLKNTDEISMKVNGILGTIQEAEQASLAQVIQNVDEITKEIKEGNGLMHAVLYDESLTRKIQNSLSNLERSTAKLEATISEIQTGDGLAHELIYGEDGEALAKQLQEASASINNLVGDIKDEKGILSTLIYDTEKAQIISDLADTASLLKEASHTIQYGNGTMALLMRDPVLYEDLRSLVGGAQRNKLLRSYIRKTVEQNELEQSQSWSMEEQ